MFAQKLNMKTAGARAAAPRRMVALKSAQQASTTVVAPPPPKTGHHTVADDLRTEALGYFFEDVDSLVCAPTTGGVNNTVQYVTTAAGEKYVLRVYNNGNNEDKVRYEHEILAQLQPLQPNLSFKVPKTKATLKDGKSYAKLSTGTCACVFDLIPGTLAKTTSPTEVGRATGELCNAMSNVVMNWKGPIAPYYELFKAHWAVGTREKFYEYYETEKAFDVCRESIDFLISEIRAIEPKLLEWEASGLPKQVLHADLHFDNVMVDGDQVSGLLDFEFCVYDWRVCELAVALSKYVGEEDPLTLCCQFLDGYVQHGELTDKEIEVLPDAIALRIFSNVVYFVGRAIAGEDSIDSLTSRAGAYSKRIRWINANRQQLIDAVKVRMASHRQ